MEFVADNVGKQSLVMNITTLEPKKGNFLFVSKAKTHSNLVIQAFLLKNDK